MKLYDASIIIIVGVLVVSVAATVASYKYFGSDSIVTKDCEKVIETEAEALILKETGIDIPFTQQPQV